LGEHPLVQRRLLIPSLASVGQEAGFAIKTKASLVRVRLFQDGTEAAVAEFSPASTMRLWRSQWAPNLPVLNNELSTVELAGEPSTEIEGELLFRDAEQQIAVLTGLVPLRDPGFKFTPILHQAHYNVLLPNFETYVVLANLVGEYIPPMHPNKMQVEIRDLSADVLAVVEIEVGFNSTFMLPIGEFARTHGVATDRGLSLRIRGGASQFAIFTAFRNIASGAVGIEHSLPPIYFTEAPFNPVLRARFQKAAFGDLRL
jgi:hypothetical protein